MWRQANTGPGTTGTLQYLGTAAFSARGPFMNVHARGGEERLLKRCRAIPPQIYFMCSTEVCSTRDGPCVEGCFGQQR